VTCHDTSEAVLRAVVPRRRDPGRACEDSCPLPFNINAVGSTSGYLRLVLRFARKYQNQGVPLLDLVQEGNIGLMRAVDKCDHRRGFRFSTYAARWITEALQRALVQRPIRLPIHLADNRRRVARVLAKFAAQHEREPTVEEIAELTGLAPSRIGAVLDLPDQPVSLDAPVGAEAHLGDFVAGGEVPADEAVAARVLGDRVEDLLSGLSERELRIARMRFGMKVSRAHTLEEVGRELSLTRERIRQIERSALQKLRARSKGCDLESFLRR
jgi:RNA polymerase primary sigma factor